MKARFTISKDDIVAYQYVVRDRVRVTSGRTWWVVLIYAALAALLSAVLVGSDTALLRLTGRRVDPWVLLSGVFIGAIFVLAMYWIYYLVMRGHIVRADGPTLAEHEFEASDDAFVVRARHSDTRYRWSAFEGVTEHGGLIVLWIEPALGLIVPRRAFADDAGANAFVALAAVRIADAAGARQ